MSKYQNYNLDFSYLTDSGHICETGDEVKHRLKRFKLFLSNRHEQNIVIVSHCGFLRELLNLWKSIGNCGIQKVDMIGAHITDAHKYKFDSNNSWLPILLQLPF